MINKCLHVVLLCAIFCTLVNCVMFKSCPGTKGKVTSVSAAGDSSTNKQATLKKNTNVSLEIVFQSETTTKTSKSVCHGVIGGLPVPFPLDNSNGCLGMSPTCPLAAGTTYTYKTALFVKNAYPKIRLVVKWEEVADDGTDIFCVLIPASIVS